MINYSDYAKNYASTIGKSLLVVISVAPNKGFIQVPDGSYVPPQFCRNRLVLTVILVFAKFPFTKKGHEFLFNIKDKILLCTNCLKSVTWISTILCALCTASLS